MDTKEIEDVGRGFSKRAPAVPETVVIIFSVGDTVFAFLALGAQFAFKALRFRTLETGCESSGIGNDLIHERVDFTGDIEDRKEMIIDELLRITSVSDIWGPAVTISGEGKLVISGCFRGYS